MANNEKQKFIDKVREVAENQVDVNDMPTSWINERLTAIGIPPITNPDYTPLVRYPLTVWVKSGAANYDSVDEALEDIADNTDPENVEEWERYERDTIPNGYLSKIELPDGGTGVNRDLAEVYDEDAERWVKLTEWLERQTTTTGELPPAPPLRELRKAVRQIILDARVEFGHCYNGVERVLRDLDLEPMGPEYNYEVPVPVQDVVVVRVSASSEEEARRMARQPRVLSRGAYRRNPTPVPGETLPITSQGPTLRF